MTAAAVLDDEQLELQRVARRLFGSSGPPRGANGRAGTVSASLPERMADLEWFGLLVDPELGGSGARLADMAVLLVEAGRVALAGPFVPTAVHAACTLAAAGAGPDGGGAAASLLGAVCGGRSFMTVGISDDGASYAPSSIVTAARRVGGEFRLSGTKLLVPEARSAAHILVAARTAGSRGEESGVSLLAVDARSPGVRIADSGAVGTRALCAVELDDVGVPVEMLLGEPDGAAIAVREAVSRCAVAEAAYGLGTAERAAELAVEHARSREQFGRPIGDFQAVQHHCVDALSDVEAMRCITFRAAAALDAGSPERHRLASVAKAWAGDALIRVTQHAHRVLGAVGFAAEGELAALTRSAQVSRHLFGTPRFHRALIAGGLSRSGPPVASGPAT